MNVCAARRTLILDPLYRVLFSDDLPHEPKVVTEDTHEALRKRGIPDAAMFPLGTPIKHGLTPVCRHCNCHYEEEHEAT